MEIGENEEENPNAKQSAKTGKMKSVKRIANKAINLALGAYLILQGYNLYQTTRDSPIRQEFRNQYGFPIYGWKEDIEGNPRNVKIISEAVKMEMQQKPFHVRYIALEPKNFLKKSPVQQVKSIFDSSKSYYADYFNAITLGSSKRYVSEYIVRHEIKHAKTRDILRENPQFRAEWEAIAKDDKGRSLYKNLFSHILGKLLPYDGFNEGKGREENIS